MIVEYSLRIERGREIKRGTVDQLDGGHKPTKQTRVLKLSGALRMVDYKEYHLLTKSYQRQRFSAHRNMNQRQGGGGGEENLRALERAKN